MSRRPLQDDEESFERPLPGTPYFQSVPAPRRPLPDLERVAAVRVAQNLQARAAKVGGHWDKHTPEEYASAALLYEQAAAAWDALGCKTDAEVSRRAAELCREKLEGQNR